MRWRHDWILWLAIVIGIGLRLDQIQTQILADDEWHGLTYLQHHGYGAIASHFGGADYCIPLTLLHRVLYDTVGLTELTIRAVPLTAGIASLIVLPLLLRPMLAPATIAAFALLLSLMPLHVYFSRNARPYSVSFFLSLLSLVALARWMQQRKARYAVLFVVATALAPWFHLTVAPFVFAPILVEAAVRLFRKDASQPSLLSLLGLGSLAAFGTLALLAAPLAVDWHTLLLKAGSAELKPATLKEALDLLCGNHYLPTIIVWLLASAAGFVIVARRKPQFARMCAVAVVAQIAAVAVARPAVADMGIVFVRYALPVVGVVTLFVAVAAGHLWTDSVSKNRAAKLASLVFLLTWIANGPLWGTYFRPNNWTNHGRYQYFYDDARNPYLMAVPAEVPEFYRQLAMQPGEYVLAEAPFHFEWHKNVLFYYQEIHRQETIVADVNGLTELDSRPFRFDDPRARLRNEIPVRDLVRLRARGVDFVVLHLNPGSEMGGWDPSEPIADIRPVIDFLTARCGEPHYRDEQVVVFKLDNCLMPPPLPDLD